VPVSDREFGQLAASVAALTARVDEIGHLVASVAALVVRVDALAEGVDQVVPVLARRDVCDARCAHTTGKLGDVWQRISGFEAYLRAVETRAVAADQRVTDLGERFDARFDERQTGRWQAIAALWSAVGAVAVAVVTGAVSILGR
jgi:hypothetical protein